MKTRNKAGNLLLAFVLALTLHVAFAIDVSADDWGDDRALHVAVDSAGAYLFTFSGTLTEGDEYISEDNILYRIATVTDGRAAYILAQKEQGAREVTAPVALPAATRFNPLWGDSLTDLAQNPEGERNRALALYYGVEAVRGDPALTAKFLPGGTP